MLEGGLPADEPMSTEVVIGLLTLQGTSVNRAVSFNKENVQEFFNIYKDVFEKHSLKQTQIWNMNETGITTVQTPCKVMAKSGNEMLAKLLLQR